MYYKEKCEVSVSTIVICRYFYLNNTRPFIYLSWVLTTLLSSQTSQCGCRQGKLWNEEYATIPELIDFLDLCSRPLLYKIVVDDCNSATLLYMYVFVRSYTAPYMETVLYNLRLYIYLILRNITIEDTTVKLGYSNPTKFFQNQHVIIIVWDVHTWTYKRLKFINFLFLRWSYYIQTFKTFPSRYMYSLMALVLP